MPLCGDEILDVDRILFHTGGCILLYGFSGKTKRASAVADQARIPGEKWIDERCDKTYPTEKNNKKEIKL